MSQDEHTMKVFIPQLGHNVLYQNWRLSIEGGLMTKGLIRYIRTALAADASATDADKRTHAFGIILSFLSFSERLAIDAILAAGTQDAHVLWADIKRRHEKVDISRVRAHWRRLNSLPDATMSDSASIDSWFTDTVAAYNAYKTSGRQIDEYTACLIMLDNLPIMWDTMRRSITQAGNADSAMTFAVLRDNMETELISRKPQVDQPAPETSQALLSMGDRRQQSGRKQSKQPRLIYQRTPGATCSKCKKANHTAQQCGKMVNQPDQQDDGTAQLTSSRRVNHELFDEDYDSDSGELHMATDSDSIDDSSALATTKDSRSDLVPPSSHWLVDCGASHSYCNDRNLLHRARHCNAGVKLGNGHRLSVLAEGEANILLPPHGHKLTITVRYVPELRRNLLSAGALGRQGIHVLCAGPRV